MFRAFRHYFFSVRLVPRVPCILWSFSKRATAELRNTRKELLDHASVVVFENPTTESTEHTEQDADTGLLSATGAYGGMTG